MRKPCVTAMILALLAPLALTPTVLGQQREGLQGGTTAPDLDAKEWLNTEGTKLSLADLRGMVVVVFFWSNLQRDRSIEASFELMNFIDSRGSELGIFVLGVTDAAKDVVEKALEKQKVFYPIGIESKAAEDYKIDWFPAVVIVSPAGKVAWTGRPGALLGEQAWTEAEKAALDERPTKTHPRHARTAEQNLSEARQALRRNNYRNAWRLARIAAERALIGDPLKTRCQDMVDLVEALGRDKLERGQRMIDEKSFSDGIVLMSEVLRDFAGAAPSRQARKRLESLAKKHPEVQKILDQQQVEQRARQKLSEAVSHLNEKNIGDAYELLDDIVKNSPDTEAAGDARNIIARIGRNDGMMGYVRDHLARRECEALLAKGRAFEASRQWSRARDIYQELIDKHGQTRFADEAAERLAKLP